MYLLLPLLLLLQATTAAAAAAAAAGARAATATATATATWPHAKHLPSKAFVKAVSTLTSSHLFKFRAKISVNQE